MVFVVLVYMWSNISLLSSRQPPKNIQLQQSWCQKYVFAVAVPPSNQSANQDAIPRSDNNASAMLRIIQNSNNI